MAQSFVVGANDPCYKVGSTCTTVYMFNIEVLFTIICTTVSPFFGSIG